MSQYNDGNVGTFEASAAIPKYARVKIAADRTISIAGLADKDIGTALEAAFDAGDMVPVKFRTGAGTEKMIAAGAVTAAAAVNTAASGKVDDAATATGFLVGTALEAATADGDVIEVLRNTHGDTAIT